ncbi:hypothetical protein ACHWQZ_G006284 [Mnemiopsis leidyi]
MAGLVKSLKAADKLNGNSKKKESKSEKELLRQWKRRQAKEKADKARLEGKYKVSGIPQVITKSKPVVTSVGKQIVAALAKYQHC